MTKYAKCGTCGYTIEIPDAMDAGDYKCPVDGTTLVVATKTEYTVTEKSAATFVVAASDSLHKERADYVCDGVNDQVEIQAGIDALATPITDESFTVGPFSIWDNMDDPIVSGWVALQGDEALAQDAADKHEGSASLKVVSGTVNDNPGAKRVGLASLDWSGYNILELWAKADDRVIFRVELYDSAGNWERFEEFFEEAPDYIDWQKLEFELDKPSDIGGVLDWADITEIHVSADTSKNGFTFRIDYVCLNTWASLANKTLQYSEVVTDNGTTYVKDTDYAMDYILGKIKPMPSGSMVSGATNYIDYDYGGGKVTLLEGHYDGSGITPKSHMTLSGQGEGTVLGGSLKLTSSGIIGFTVKDLLFSNASGSEMSLSKAHGCGIQNCAMYPSKTIYSPVVYIGPNSTDCLIENCQVGSDQNNSSIRVSFNTKRIFILNNRCERGIWLDGADLTGHLVYSCKVIGNICERGVIYLDNAYDSQIANNTVPSIYLKRGSKRNTIANNKCEHATMLSDLGNGDAIRLEDGCNNNVISNNVCQNPERRGIHIYDGSNYNTIVGNCCLGCTHSIYGDGIALTTNSRRNIVSGNVISGNAAPGIMLEVGCDHNIITGNNVFENDFDGITIYKSDYNIIEGNILTDNGQATNNTYSDIRIWGTGSGANASIHNIVKGNICRATLANKVKYNISEETSYDDYNQIEGNDLSGAVTAKIYNLGAHSILSKQLCDIFMDVLAVSNVHIHAAQAGNSASQDVAATAQPDVPRNSKLTTTNNAQVLEGCLCDDGGTVTDETADINNVAANDVPLLPAAPEENDATCFGNYDKFDKLTVDIGTQGVKAPGDWSIVWEYWDGDSWEALTGVTDGTAEFTAAAGNHDVTFTVPSDWAEKEISITAGGSITAYWIRARVDAATTNPIGAQPLADQGWLGIYGTVTVTGVDAKGKSTTDSLLITRTNAGGTVALDVAFATVTKYNIPAGVSAANTVACGIGLKLGLSNVIYETGDVYKIKKDNADAVVAAAEVNTAYDTYDMTVIGLAATNDFTIWFKSNLNLFS